MQKNQPDDIYFIFNKEQQLVTQSEKIAKNNPYIQLANLPKQDQDFMKTGIKPIYLKNFLLVNVDRELVIQFLSQNFQDEKVIQYAEFYRLRISVLGVPSQPYFLFKFPKCKFQESSESLEIRNKTQTTLDENKEKLSQAEIDQQIQQLIDYYQIDNQIKPKDIINILKQKAAESRLQVQKDLQISSKELRSSFSMEYFSKNDIPKIFQQLQNQEKIQEVSKSSLESSDDLEQQDKYMSDEKLQNQTVHQAENQQTKEQNNQHQHNILYKKQNDLDYLTNWNLDITEVKDKNEKLRLVWVMFELCNFVKYLEIEEEIFYNFLVEVETKYQHHNNPFHNFDHGITVTHAMFCFLQRDIGDQYISHLDKFILLLASLGHDLDHTGHNNAFECAKMSDIAIRYNDESVLENHHASTLFEILRNPKSNILKKIPNEDFRVIRRRIISCILHTDMKKHFETVNKFKAKIQSAEVGSEELSFKTEEDIQLIQGFMVHCADLSGPTRIFKIAQQWSLNISKEFTNQVNEEQELGLPITKYLCGLTTMEKISKEEINFIKAIIQPLWNIMNDFDSRMDFACKNIEDNIVQWEKIYQQEIQKNQNKLQSD